MTQEQLLLFGLFGGVFILLLWGRFRYDLVAFSALIEALARPLVLGPKIIDLVIRPQQVNQLHAISAAFLP